MRSLLTVLVCALCGASWTAAVAQEGAAAVEVWPTRARTLADGRVEYVYDLRPLKSGKVPVDPGPEGDSAAVKAFLASLPNETKVLSRPEAATLSIDDRGGLAHAPYAASFSALPALLPDAPKELPSADLLLWKNDVVQDGVVAGISLAADAGEGVVPIGRRALLERLLDGAIERYRSTTGLAKEGAKRLVVRVGGILGASNGRIPDRLLAIPELREAVEATAAELTRPEPRFPPSPRNHWSPALTAAALRERALGESLGVDRQGHAAALTLLGLLDTDPKLKAAWEAQRILRDRLLGKPRSDRLEAYRAASPESGPVRALDDLSSFLERLSPADRSEGAAIMSRAESPLSRFVDLLHGPEQLHAIDELTLAVQDGRYSLAGDESGGWAAGRHRWASSLLRPGEFPTGSWRSRLVRTFQALFGLHSDVAADAFDAAPGEPSGWALKVRLKVPPHLELEPLPDAYAEAASSWSKLGLALKEVRGAERIRGVRPDGSRRAATVAREAEELSRLYRGLALLSRISLGEDAARSDADAALVENARRYLARWRTDPDLRQDVRYLLPASTTADEGVILHSGTYGVSRREIEVRFERPPELELQTAKPGQADLFVTDVEAPQRYQVPVLATGAVQVARTAPLGLREFQRLCDQVGRTREAIDAALPGAMVRSLQQVSMDEVP